MFLFPLGALSLHAFANHKHTVCISKIEKHIHESDVDCDLHLIKQNDTLFVLNTFKERILINTTETQGSQYYFLKNHFQLSFSLRGPPTII